jgi:hypothetical protein
LGKCELCIKNEEGLGLRQANHKEKGKIWVCGDCWSGLYQKNKMIAGTTGGSNFSCSGKCGSCPHS